MSPNIPTFSAEELEAMRSIALWMKIQNSGTLVLLAILLWRAFKLYARLLSVETSVGKIDTTNYITRMEHERMQSECRFRVSSEIDSKGTALHMKLLEELQDTKEEISAVRETQCHMLGKLEQIGSTLSNIRNFSQPPPNGENWRP